MKRKFFVCLSLALLMLTSSSVIALKPAETVDNRPAVQTAAQRSPLLRKAALRIICIICTGSRRRTFTLSTPHIPIRTGMFTLFREATRFISIPLIL